MPPSAQLPPTQLKRVKEKDDQIEDEKVALAKQRQDRLDRERREANIKYALGIAGSLGATALSLYLGRQKLTQQQAILAEKEADRLLAYAKIEEEKKNRNTSVMRDIGKTVKGTGAGAVKVYQTAPTFWNTLTTLGLAYLGTGGFSGTRVEDLSQQLGRKTVGTAVGIGTGFLKGASAEVYEQLKRIPFFGDVGIAGTEEWLSILYEEYTRLTTDQGGDIPSYSEFKKQFGNLRGKDYANTTGLQFPPSFFPNLSKVPNVSVGYGDLINFLNPTEESPPPPLEEETWTDFITRHLVAGKLGD